jgi:hypothetical protein
MLVKLLVYEPKGDLGLPLLIGNWWRLLGENYRRGISLCSIDSFEVRWTISTQLEEHWTTWLMQQWFVNSERRCQYNIKMGVIEMGH